MAKQHQMMFRSFAPKPDAYSLAQGIRTLQVDIWPQLDPDARTNTNVVLTWYHQTRKEGDYRPHNWYGFHLKIDAQEDYTFDAQVALVRRLRGRDTLPLGFYIQPVDVLARLQALHAVEVTYDSRVSRFVPLAELVPLDYTRWIDDYDAYGQPGCRVGCLARSREEAQRLLLVKYADLPHRLADMLDWIKADRPVKCTTGGWLGSTPDPKTMAQRIAEIDPPPERVEDPDTGGEPEEDPIEPPVDTGGIEQAECAQECIDAHAYVWGEGEAA